MRIAERKNHVLPFHFGAVSDADDVEILLESCGDAGDGIGHQRARQAVQRAMFVTGALGGEHAVLLLEVNSARQRDVHLALGSLHFDGVVLDRYLHPGRYRDQFVSNSRHGFIESSLPVFR